MLLSLALVGAAVWVLQSRSTQEGCTRLTRTLEAPPPQSSTLVVAAPTPAPPAPVSEPVVAEPAPPSPAVCRVLALTDNGKPVPPTDARIGHEWARGLCTRRAQPGGRPYRLSESGVSVECVCD
jgi:hypothetical protein